MDAVKATLIYAELGNQEEAQWTCGREEWYEYARSCGVRI